MSVSIRNIALALLLLTCAACTQSPGAYNYNVANADVSGSPVFTKTLQMQGY